MVEAVARVRVREDQQVKGLHFPVEEVRKQVQKLRDRQGVHIHAPIILIAECEFSGGEVPDGLTLLRKNTDFNGKSRFTARFHRDHACCLF